MDPFGVIATRKPLVLCLRRTRPTLQQIPLLPSPLGFLPDPRALRRQLDSLSPHILCLICQPKPSGPAGQSGGDGSPTSLFSHCISTPADINHGGSTSLPHSPPVRLAHRAAVPGFRLILSPAENAGYEKRPSTFCSNFRLSAVHFGRQPAARSPVISTRPLAAHNAADFRAFHIAGGQMAVCASS